MAKVSSLIINSSYEIPKVLKIEAEHFRIPKKKYDLPFNIKNVNDLEAISRDIRGEDNLRPQMGFVYLFGDLMAFTDAHKLFYIPISEKKNGVIDPTGSDPKPEETAGVWGKEVMNDKKEHQFFKILKNYTTENFGGKVNCELFYKYLKFISTNISRKNSRRPVCILTKNVNDDDRISINPQFMMDCLEVFMQLGINDVFLYRSSRSSGILLSEKEIKSGGSVNDMKIFDGVVCLIMPVMNDNEENAFIDIDYDTEFNLFYDVSKNKIVNKGGQIDDFYATQSILSIDDFQFTYKDFKKNYGNVKKIMSSATWIVNDFLKEMGNKFEDKSQSEMGNYDKKVFSALNWFSTFYYKAS